MSASAKRVSISPAKGSSCVLETSRVRSFRRIIFWRLRKKDKLERVGRGMYAIPGAAHSEHHTIVQAAMRLPHGVVCLLSALRFHDLTTQSPFEVWMAIDGKARSPKEDAVYLSALRSTRLRSSDPISKGCNLAHGLPQPMMSESSNLM